MALAGIRPNSRLGQNFLLDGNLADYIVRSGGMEPGDIVLEVGPGAGSLTTRLARTGARVLAVELDRQLADRCARETAPFPNVRVMQADILAGASAVNPLVAERLSLMLAAPRQGEALAAAPRLLCVSNLPYSAGTPFVMNLLSSDLPWKRGIYLLQYEVGLRMTAAPGTPEYGALSIGGALAAKVKILRKVPPDVFWPRPKVDSALIEVDYHPAPERLSLPWTGLRRATRAVFGARRKTLRNALRAWFREEADAAIALRAMGIDSMRRGETLTPQEFLALARWLDSGLAD